MNDELRVADLDALDVCTEVCSILEDSPLTNAGIGSNLTRDGTVELDALVMISDPPLFGAAGALPGFNNPVMVAKDLLKAQRVRYMDKTNINSDDYLPIVAKKLKDEVIKTAA